MSLAHDILSMNPAQQQEAIRALAHKAANRKEFERMTRPLLHAHYAGGASKEQSKQLRHEWRLAYQAAKRIEGDRNL